MGEVLGMAVQYADFARLYDILMADVDYDKWAEYICMLIGESAPGAKKIADCACGTGKITIRLKKAGFDVTGLDISREMLEVASENAREAGVMIPFVCMDMQKLVLHRPHDVIVAACDGANYLTSVKSLESFFASAYDSLKSGGLLCFDISSRYKLEKVLGCNTFAEDEGSCAYIWKNMYDIKSKLIEMNLSFFEKNDKGYTRFCERHIQRAHSVAETENALKRAGFVNIAVYEAFTKNAPAEDTERLQFTAIKP